MRFFQSWQHRRLYVESSHKHAEGGVTAGRAFNLASSSAACDSLYTILPAADGSHQLAPIMQRGTLVQTSHSGAAAAATLTADLLAASNGPPGASPVKVTLEAQTVCTTCSRRPGLSGQRKAPGPPAALSKLACTHLAGLCC